MDKLNRWIESWIDGQRVGQMDKKLDRGIENWIDGKKVGQIDRKLDRQIDRKQDRWIELVKTRVS